MKKKGLFKNWKTNLFGFSAVISGVVMIVKGNAIEGISAILAGLGLGSAKDHDTE